MVLLADGKFLTAATTNIFGETWDFAVTKYNADGTLDATFGNNGYAANGSGHAQWLAVQPDGKIVLIGFLPIFRNGSDYLTARFNADGTVDQSFGIGGRVQTSFTSGRTSADNALAGALQSDGKIILTGFAGGFSPVMIRYNSDGAVDTSFGLDGIVMSSSFGATANRILIQPDDKIVVSGGGFVVARYNPNGTTDQGFGSGGRVVGGFGSGNGAAHALASDSSGRLYVSGSVCYTNTGNCAFLVGRYTKGGEHDNAFGINGFVVTEFTGALDEANAEILQEKGGKLILAGYAAEPSASDVDFSLARYLTNTIHWSTADRLGEGDANIEESISAFDIRTDHNSEIQDRIGGTIIWSHQGSDNTTHNGAIAYSADGKLVASGRADSNDVNIWNATDGTLIRTLNGQNNNANVIKFSPDGQYLATGTGQAGQGLSLNLWRVSDGTRLVGRIGAFTNGTIGLSFSPDGQFLAASGFHTNFYKVYRVPDMTEVGTFGNFDPTLGYNTRIFSIAYSRDGRFIAVGATRGVYLRSASDGSLVRIINPNYPNAMTTYGIAFSPDGTSVAAGVSVLDSTYGNCIECAIKLLRLEEGALLHTYTDPSGMVFPSVDFSPDGQIISAGFSDSNGTVTSGATEFWVVSSEKILRRDGRAFWIQDFAYSSSGRTYAFEGADGIVAVAYAPQLTILADE